LDPWIHIQYPAYTRGINDDIFIKGATFGLGRLIFLIFLIQRLKDRLEELHDHVKFLGIWLDMNELSNFVNRVNLEGCGMEANSEFQERGPIYEKSEMQLIT